MCEYMEQDLKVSVSKYVRCFLGYDPENLKMDGRAQDCQKTNMWLNRYGVSVSLDGSNG